MSVDENMFDEQFVEASRVFAKRILKSGRSDFKDRLDYAFERPIHSLDFAVRGCFSWPFFFGWLCIS